MSAPCRTLALLYCSEATSDYAQSVLEMCRGFKFLNNDSELQYFKHVVGVVLKRLNGKASSSPAGDTYSGSGS